MSKYRVVWDSEGILAKFENEEITFLRENYSAPERSDLPTPMILRDIEPYQNMVNGKMINSRSEHRAFLREHNLTEIGNETKYLKPAPKKLPPGLKERIIEVANNHPKFRY